MASKKTNFLIEADPWLQGHFGVPVFRLSLPASLEEAQLVSGLSSLDRSTPAFYYTKIATDQVHRLPLLGQAGFQVIDVNVLFETTPSKQDLSALPAQVRLATPEDKEAVLAIAESCFQYSRFHLDPLVSEKLANQIKRDWIQNYFEKKRGESLWVAEHKGRIAGFCAILKTNQNDRPVRIIDLIGVSRDHWRLGIGRALVQHFQHDSQTQCHRIQVGTQIANIPSMSLYEKCGFRVAGSKYILHAHVRN